MAALDQGKKLVMIHDEISLFTLLISLYKTFGQIEINQLLVTVYLSPATVIKLGQSDVLFINQSTYCYCLLDPNDSV